MATAVLFTTVEAIRSCVGLDVADLPDAIVLSQNLKTQFTTDLDGWYPSDYVSIWSAGNYDPTDDSDQAIATPSAAERAAHLLSVYSMWFGAYRVIESLLAVPQSNSDGKNELRRFANIDLEALIQRVRSNMTLYKGVILEEVSSVSATVLGPVVVEDTGYDPVTGV